VATKGEDGLAEYQAEKTLASIDVGPSHLARARRKDATPARLDERDPTGSPIRRGG